jgi:hypothetical protein
MKADIVNYEVICLECQQVKAEHRHLVGLLQPHAIPESKWEVIVRMCSFYHRQYHYCHPTIGQSHPPSTLTLTERRILVAIQ